MPRVSCKIFTIKKILKYLAKIFFQFCLIEQVQSAICYPSNGAVVKRDEEKLKIKGYAFSGAGKGILKVLLSIDGGENWITTELKMFERPYNK